jgi:glutathionylspermidine synthase
VPDPDPLDEQLSFLIQAEQSGKLSILNPMGSIVPQDKLSMAFFWEQLHRFSPQNQQTILDLMPPTWRVDTLGRQRLIQEREHWVLKSDFGCEGEEVAIGRFCAPDVWEKTVEMMTEGNWIAQRFFRASALEGGHIPNYGVYLIAGEPAGVLTRLNPGREATSHEALVAPTFVRRAPDAPQTEEA